MFKWLRGLRAAPSIPDDAWQATLARYPFLAGRPDADAQRLRALAAEFLRDKEFHGAHGFVITDEVALAVAAQAVLPVLHLPGGLDWYDDFVGIVMHPSEVVARRKTMDETGVVHEYDEVVAGEAMDRGPVMLSWQDVLASSVTASEGYNVVIHEFAHKIDMQNGDANGCPPLPDAAARDQWLKVMRDAYEDFGARVDAGEDTAIDPYAAETPGEFFAVLSEVFFAEPALLVDEYPDVYREFARFYRQDPAATRTS
jgi:Mlc titration factor MtfA (ptsG expression regulator)